MADLGKTNTKMNDQSSKTFWQKDELYLFGFIFVGLLLSISGHGTFVDENLIIQSVESLVERGNLTVFDMYQALLGPDGNYYSRYGIGFTILMVPFYVVGQFLPHHPMFMGNPNMFVMLLGNMLFTVMIALVFYKIARLLNGSKRNAILLSTILIFATPFWPYSQTLFRLNISILVLLLMLWSILKHEQKSKKTYLVYLLVLTALAANLREDLVFAVGFLTIYAITFGEPQKKYYRCGAIIVGGLIGILIWCLHNYMRFEKIFIENYSDLSFDYDLIISVPGLLWGQRTGLLLYSPIILLFPLSYFAAKNADRLRIWFLGLFIFITYLILYGKSDMWYGGICFGPRHLYFLIPFFILPIVWFLDHHPSWWKYLMTALFSIWGIVFNWPGVYAHQGRYSSFFDRPDFFNLLQRPIQHPNFNTELDIDLWWLRMIKLEPISIWPIAFACLFGLWLFFGYKLIWIMIKEK